MEKVNGVEKTLGAQLKEFRKAQGLTQQEVAEKLGISDAYVSKLEKGMGTPNFHVKEKIMEYLACRVEPQRPKPYQVAERVEGTTSKEKALFDMVHGDEELLSDVIKYTQEKKLLKELLSEKTRKKAG